MFVVIIFCLSTLKLYSVLAQGECTDVRGRLIANGLHYAPGPDTCTLCICGNGLPKDCKAVLCSPPQDCRSFRVGAVCCEFICLDDAVKPAEGAEGSVRVAAGGAAAALLLAGALLAYRVRRQKRRRPAHADDQRSLTSIGYISGSMGYMGGTCETALTAWKPPGNYMPRGEAPPPYDEAVAQCREPLRMSTEAYHRSFPTMDAMVRPEDALACAGHGYVNIQRPVAQMANPQGCYTAPLLAGAPEPREPALVALHPLAPAGAAGFAHAVRLTGSLGAISARALSVPRDERERAHNVPGFYTSALHRTIPRISAAGETGAGGAVAFARGERALAGDVRRSFHRAEPPRARADTGRSVPRNLNIAAAADDASLRPAGGRSRAQSEEQMTCGANATNTTSSVASGVSSCLPSGVSSCLPSGVPSGLPSGVASGVPSGAPSGAPSVPTKAPPPPPTPPPSASLPLTVDKPSCGCSYEGASAPGDDYRSECENCKDASGSRWARDEREFAAGDAQTQTLQRRAPPPPPPPATATLPQPVTRHPLGSTIGTPSNWENWFNSIPDSDTESEEE